MCRILGGNDKQTCRAIAERFEEKYDQSLADALKKELRGTICYSEPRRKLVLASNDTTLMA